MSLSSQQQQPPTPNILLDGYVSYTFGPQAAEEYLTFLLHGSPNELRPIWTVPNWPGAAFITHSSGPHAQPLAESPHGPLWLLDYAVRTNGAGTVVPQRIWRPQSEADQMLHVRNASLEMPVFFVHRDGRVGLTLNHAAGGVLQTLRGVDGLAPLGGKTTTHIHLSWPGYRDWKRQVQIRDETAERQPITLGRFVRHVGRSVHNFLQQCEIDPAERRDCSRWRIGEPGGITRDNIIIIGVVHVSAGRWMPIIQLSRYIDIM